MKEMEEMAINEIKVLQDGIEIEQVSEDFQRDRESGEYRVNSYGDETYSLDVSITMPTTERGLTSRAGQIVSVEVPVENAEAELKRIRAIPARSAVRFEELSVRIGNSASTGRGYAMWTGKGLQTTGKSAPSAPAPAAAQRQG